MRLTLVLLFVLWIAPSACGAVEPGGSRFTVQLPAPAAHAESGRLLVFVQPAAQGLAGAKGGPVTAVELSPFQPAGGAVAAVDVTRLAPGGSVQFDGEAIAWPAPFSQLAAGDYFVQAVLDTGGDDNYAGRGDDDVLSTPVRISLGGESKLPVLLLDQHVAHRDPWTEVAKTDAKTRAEHAQARQDTQELDFVSPRLSAFWGRPVHIRGWVVLPPGYDPAARARYPVVYETHGFGGTLPALVQSAERLDAGMRSGEWPPMIRVLLDQSSATGTHEFADSVNNGPWGTALIEELMPALEQRYRMDATPAGRLLTGHSSGGWAALWLQVRYPRVFGGSWPTSPDPSDFHDFTGVDLYAPGANVYRRADGSAYPLVRDHQRVIASFEQFARLENVIGPVGGQMASFDWVFSPRGRDGRPQPMFDRATGVVDPAVVAYWREHYDIAERIRTHWPALKADLDGKIHLIVGTADTFYLDGAAHRLQATLDGLGARSDFRFLPDRTHFDLYTEGDDRRALSKRIAREMYAVARPGKAWGPPATAGSALAATSK